MKRIKVSVKRKHIRGGLPGDDGRCPVSLAAIERITALGLPGKFDCAEDDVPTIRPGATRIHMPRSVSRFIRRFDAGKPVKPFAYFIQIPE